MPDAVGCHCPSHIPIPPYPPYPCPCPPYPCPCPCCRRAVTAGTVKGGHVRVPFLVWYGILTIMPCYCALVARVPPRPRPRPLSRSWLGGWTYDFLRVGIDRSAARLATLLPCCCIRLTLVRQPRRGLRYHWHVTFCTSTISTCEIPAKLYCMAADNQSMVANRRVAAMTGG